MENNHGSELDRIIDGALSGYSEAEPLAGLEQRVVNRIRIAETRRTRFRFWQFGVAGAVALLVVVVVALWTDRSPAPRPTVAEVVRPPKPPVSTGSSPAPATRLPTRRTRRARVLPKEPQFPTIAPLTAEERALIALAQYPPSEVGSRFADGPIEIQAIEIKPLQRDGSQ